MDALIVYPDNKDQLEALKAVMKAMKIAFEQTTVTYPEDVVTGVRASLKEANEGALMPYTNIQDMLKA